MWESLVSNKGLMGWDRFFFIFFNWISLPIKILQGVIFIQIKIASWETYPLRGWFPEDGSELRHMPRWRDLSCQNLSHQQHRWGKFLWFLVGFGFQTLEVVTKIWLDVMSEIVRWWRKKRGFVNRWWRKPKIHSIISSLPCPTFRISFWWGWHWPGGHRQTAGCWRAWPGADLRGWGNRWWEMVNYDPSMMFCLECWESITFHVLYVMCMATV